MVDQALDNKIDGLEDVTARFIITKFNIAELDNFTYKIEFRLGNGMEKGTVSVIWLCIILAKEGESNLMSGIIEEFLL